MARVYIWFKLRTMNIGILGSGIVAQTLGARLAARGHRVMIGSRSPNNESALRWAKDNKAAAGHFSEAASMGDIVFNCTMGIFSPEAVRVAGIENLRRKILVDVANPLDFSSGMPPRLTICNDHSLGEELQKILPETKVVKALNTINNEIMVNPGMITGGHAEVHICGNDEEAKATVTEMIIREFGWKRESIIDLGSIIHARGTEAMLLFIISLAMKYGSFYNSIKAVRG